MASLIARMRAFGNFRRQDGRLTSTVIGMVDPPANIVPIFALDVVLLPGSALPLHIFEPRYRSLLKDVCAPGGPRAFGVISVQAGASETGPNAGQLAEVGTMAEVIEVDPYPDGRSDLLTIGSRRFRILEIDQDSKAYLCARVEWLEEADGVISTEHVAAARLLCRRYSQLLAAASGREVPEDDLSDDPLRLSYQIAARLRLPAADRQRLLEAESAAARLYASISALRRETALISCTGTVPVSPSSLRVATTSN
jgi:Lon protease-like protein